MVSKVVERATTVGAALPGHGQGQVQARSGAEALLAGLASEPGFTPLELMDAALAGCLVLSVRIAVRKLGWDKRLNNVDVDVTHHKGPEARSRVAAFDCRFEIEGDFSEAERSQLIAEAHRICTVGNTLQAGAEIRDLAPE